MLIVGEVSSEDERCELRLVVQVFIIEERLRYLARKKRKNKV